MIERLLSDLVRIRSVNPQIAGGLDTDSEAELASYVSNLFRVAGIDVELQEVHPGRSNVIAHIHKSRTGSDDESVLLSSHMDTYPGSSTGHEEFEPRIIDGRLYGRGSADTKASLAAMISAALSAARARERREIYMVASIDEEYGLTGAKRLLDQQIYVTLAITGEPTKLQPVTAQKGIVRFAIHVHGEAFHAAHPSDENSIFRSADVIKSIETFSKTIATQFIDEELGHLTLTPTIIKGKGDMNRPPKRCTIHVDARFLPDTSADQVLTQLLNHLQAQLRDEIRFQIEEPYFVSPANRCPVANPMVGELFELVQESEGRCVPTAFAFGSEAGVLAAIAQASLVLGPGDPRFAHGPGENVELAEVERAAKIYENIVLP